MASTVCATVYLPDVVAYAEFTNMRKQHTNETSFVRFSDDRSQLELVNQDLFAAGQPCSRW